MGRWPVIRRIGASSVCGLANRVFAMRVTFHARSWQKFQSVGGHALDDAEYVGVDVLNDLNDVVEASLLRDAKAATWHAVDKFTREKDVARRDLNHNLILRRTKTGR